MQTKKECSSMLIKLEPYRQNIWANYFRVLFSYVFDEYDTYLQEQTIQADFPQDKTCEYYNLVNSM
ncbi:MULTISPECIES: hypothetical protein [unclassified Campylobacter]|uniref:hypothetical protein n=1 Tax=unclassified Campylobacter TaxID=2593542 RepID=UPI001237DE37|nr:MULTISPECIES: hypothetical protein [unclassified Campylobacter]KAA6225027.1 hypothetical protein FMM54_06695 [Campylobacter sp. LR185c]KAA6225986.1 hypothetical protein FMM55_05540 [Campylobacter sp. LR196d]KAA6226069.1 hypothetical protein FMM57_06650 [Campylobacter sp. LR286c]KAA6230981.1 hypothetical protein FMM58_03935 [Campylobacter sp. LR291e]